MKSSRILHRSILVAIASIALSVPAFSAEPSGFSTLKTKADLDALIASTKDAALKKAINDNAAPSWPRPNNTRTSKPSSAPSRVPPARWRRLTPRRRR